MSRNILFCAFQYQAVQKGNQHSGRKYDDLKICQDITSHENPVLSRNLLGALWAKSIKVLVDLLNHATESELLIAYF